MILVQISDSHLSFDVAEGPRRSADLMRTVEAINKLVPRPDAVIHTGDLANRGQPREYAEARRRLDQLEVPMYAVPGNRDDRDGLREAFVTRPCLSPDAPFVQYCVDDHAVRLLALDSRSDRSNLGSYCDARHASLVQALAEQPARPTLVFMHHPPFEVAGDPNSFQYEDRAEFDRLADTLTGSGQVIRILCGHAHRARGVELNGVAASTVPSLAVDLRQGDDPLRPSSLPRFQIHEYHDGRGFTSTEVEVQA